jgi:hypothetical protein
MSAILLSDSEASIPEDIDRKTKPNNFHQVMEVVEPSKLTLGPLKPSFSHYPIKLLLQPLRLLLMSLERSFSRSF